MTETDIHPVEDAQGSLLCSVLPPPRSHHLVERAEDSRHLSEVHRAVTVNIVHTAITTSEATYWLGLHTAHCTRVHRLYPRNIFLQELGKF